jgi:hypothetical protein
MTVFRRVEEQMLCWMTVFRVPEDQILCWMSLPIEFAVER